LDFVYFCRPGNNEELRYSIRSLYANYKNATVWVVGEKPDWYVGNFIYVEQGHSKFNNVLESIKVVCSSDQIKSSFVLMNDDFFILKPINPYNMYHGGKLSSKIDKYDNLMPSASYVQMLKNTFYQLTKLGVSDPLDYELHIPMMMNKKKLFRSLRQGVLWRSMYGNLNKVGGEMMDDVKVYISGVFKNNLSYNLEDYDIFLSTDDNSFNLFKDQLDKLFPKASINEAQDRDKFVL
jgi:hypothetical protein